MATIKVKDGTEILLQGLGNGSADRFLARLAAERGRLGRADAVLRAAWLSRDRARPARSWALEPDVGRQRYGHLRGRSGGAIRSARSEERDHGGAFHRRWRGRTLSGSPRHQARRQGGADQRRAAADAEDGKESSGRAPLGLRRSPRGSSRPTGRSSTRTSRCRFTATTARARRFRRASASTGGCRA